MRTVLVSALVLGLTASASLAGEPVELTAGQMDSVKADQIFRGGLLNVSVRNVRVLEDVDIAAPISVDVDILSGGIVDVDVTRVAQP